MDKANGKTKNTRVAESIFFCKRIPAIMSVRCNDFIQSNPDYDIKIIFAVLDDKILATGEETLKEIVGD